MVTCCNHCILNPESAQSTSCATVLTLVTTLVNIYIWVYFFLSSWNVVQELPAPILDDVAIHKPVEQPRLSCEPSESLDAMKIAWRYQNLPKVQVIRRLYYLLTAGLVLTSWIPPSCSSKFPWTIH